MKELRIAFSLILLWFTVTAHAQLGGSSTFSFLRLPSSARAAALGGHLTAFMDDDVLQGWQNPSMINSSMHNRLATTTVNYLSDIRFGHLAYGRKLGKTGTWIAGIHYINYGDIAAYDQNANFQNTLKAGEQCFYAGYGYQFNKNIIFGTNLKFIASNLGGFISNGIGVDFGSSYRSSDSLFIATVQLKNMGSQLQRYYTGAANEPLPFEFQAGISFKPKHMPIRFSFSGTNLNTSATTFINPNKPKKFDLDSGIEIPQTIPVSAKIFSHLSLGGEFIIAKVAYMQIGYNYRIRRDMVLEDFKGLTGFCWGFGLRLKKFGVQYGLAQYHPGQTTHHFSLALNLNHWKINLFTKK